MNWIKKPSTLLIIAALSLGALAFAGRYTAQADAQNDPVEIGEKAPDIALKDPQGDVHRLSDLRGKLVLVDFWASWCRPCRMENPHVVKLFKKYKDEQFTYGDGFTVYSVSLDRNKQDWVRAIQQDGLVWPHHVSDLKMWNSAAAARYNITAIPATYLIDENGVVLAKNLRGQALENALAKMAK